MNVAEAVDLNVLLCYFLGIDGTDGDRIEPQHALASIKRAADRAHARLRWGLTSQYAAQAFEAYLGAKSPQTGPLSQNAANPPHEPPPA